MDQLQVFFVPTSYLSPYCLWEFQARDCSAELFLVNLNIRSCEVPCETFRAPFLLQLRKNLLRVDQLLLSNRTITQALISPSRHQPRAPFRLLLTA